MKKNTQKILISMKKSRTLMDKVITMVEEDEYCIDIIQQNLAIIWLLKSSNLNLLEWHLGCCFVDAAKANDGERMNEMIQEILIIVKTAQNK